MIGVFGGTFNPVHFGHLRTALEVKEALNLQQLRLIPCRLPAHRQEPEVAAELRLTMLQLAIAATPGLQIDNRELERPGPSYMVDTLRSLRAESGDTPMALVIGADAFAGLESWHDWRRLFDYAHVVVMTRPGYAEKNLPDFFRRRLLKEPALLSAHAAGSLFFQPVTLLDISATQIRRIIAAGASAQFLLPDAVLNFIQQHQLYQTTPLKQDIECKATN
ncbi:MAG: nicotinate-nucleotide adenylyltransferase [Methylomonas sp.]|jgi:nicotinate-nucleotide adenylyltransferase